MSLNVGNLSTYLIAIKMVIKGVAVAVVAGDVAVAVVAAVDANSIATVELFRKSLYTPHFLNLTNALVTLKNASIKDGGEMTEIENFKPNKPPSLMLL